MSFLLFLRDLRASVARVPGFAAKTKSGGANPFARNNRACHGDNLRKNNLLDLRKGDKVYTMLFIFFAGSPIVCDIRRIY